MPQARVAKRKFEKAGQGDIERSVDLAQDGVKDAGFGLVWERGQFVCEFCTQSDEMCVATDLGDAYLAVPPVAAAHLELGGPYCVGHHRY
jgi:hypothetical protein